MRCGAFAFSVLLWLCGCSTSSEPAPPGVDPVEDGGALMLDSAVPPQSGEDAAVSVDSAVPPTPDTSAPDATTTPPAACTIGADPEGLPPIVGTIVADDGAGVPAVSGGPIEGIVRFDTAAMHVSSAFRFVVDAAMSSSNGTGWAEFSGGHLRMNAEMMMHFVRNGMAMDKAMNIAAMGDFTTSGAAITLVNECAPPEGAEDAEISMSYGVSAGRLTLVILVSSFMGDISIVLSGNLTSS